MVPFVVLIFYILGGGQTTEEAGQASNLQTPGEGANYRLPEADRSIDIIDKMDSYNQQAGQVTTRDYDILGEEGSISTNSGELIPDTVDPMNADPVPTSNQLNADISNNLLAHIQRQEQQARKDLEAGTVSSSESVSNKDAASASKQNGNLSQKEVKKGVQGKSQPVADPADNFSLTGIEELERVFDENILLERQNDSLSQTVNQLKYQLAEWETASAKETMPLEKVTVRGFDTPETPNGLIRAEIYETETVLSGNRVKLRLLEDCNIKGQLVPAGTFIYGICTLGGERVDVEISQIPVTGGFLPVELSVLDMDGLPGLYIPDQASRKVVKNVTGSVRSTTLLGTSTDPLTAVGIQAAGQAAQSLVQVVRQKKVTLLKNTLVYLTNKNQ